MSRKGKYMSNPRIKAMLEICNESKPERRKETKQANVQDSSRITKKPPEEPFNETFNNCNSEQSLVESLYAKNYSMVTPFFVNFPETKTSYNDISGPSTSYDFDLLLSADNLKCTDPSPEKYSHAVNDQLIDPLVSQPSQDIINLVSPHLKLICEEVISPPSVSLLEETIVSENPINCNQSPTDFSSDDSVWDKNYSPSSTDSEGTDKENNIRNLKCRTQPKISNQNNDLGLSGKNKCKRAIASTSANCAVLRDIPENCSKNDTLEPREGNNNEEALTASTSNDNTVQGKKNKNSTSVRVQRIEKQIDKRLSYEVKTGCGEKCYKKCSAKFTDEYRESINWSYWNLSWSERRLFIKSCTETAIPKRKTTNKPQRTARQTFSFKNNDNMKTEVCKAFFLTTLGFKKSNDMVLYNSLKGDLIDKRGLHVKTPASDRNNLKTHVESFQPLAPHYRREHAPLRRYLPSDVNITLMHKDYCEKYPSHNVSYEFYRKVLKEMNISFAKLGNEECEVCVAHNLHCKQTLHEPNNNVLQDCDNCQSWKKHQECYTKSRKLYESHKTLTQDKDNIYYSTDLQKVIMLPRLDGFKKIIFCPRLTTYNQSFAPVGKITNISKPTAVIWHDALSGRKQEDIMSALYHFFIQHRDVKNVHMWMDNCSAQNKNWLLFSLITYLINSDYIATESITFYYFEPGHTYMSCDQFHHQVEKCMKAKSKLYDFMDFRDSVAAANKSRVYVKTMTEKDFFHLPNFVSERRLQNTTPRVYLKDVVQISFHRGMHDMLYKNDLDSDFKTLRYMTDKYLKNPSMLRPEFKTVPKGIEPIRKQAIIQALTGITPPHKMVFWNEIPVSKET